MDKDHLVELITSSLLYERKTFNQIKNLIELKNYLKKLNLIQLCIWKFII